MSKSPYQNPFFRKCHVIKMHQESHVNQRHALISDPEASELAQPREGAFYDPAIDTQPAAVRVTPACNTWLNAAALQFGSVSPRTVGPTGKEVEWPGAGSPRLTRDGWNPVHESHQRNDVVRVRTRDLEGQRDALTVRENMLLRARAASIRRVGPRLFAPHRPDRTGVDHRPGTIDPIRIAQLAQE